MFGIGDLSVFFIETVPAVYWCIDPTGKLQRLVHVTESETNIGKSTTVKTSPEIIHVQGVQQIRLAC